MRLNSFPRPAARSMRLSEIPNTSRASQIASPSDDVELQCPRYGEPLRLLPSGVLRGESHGEEYPIIEGVPILLIDPEDRASALAQGALRTSDPLPGGAISPVLAHLARLLDLADASGPILALGTPAQSGLPQGNWVVVDNSVARLCACSAMPARVCASIGRLPFVEESFAAAVHFGLPGTGADLAHETLRVLRTGGVAVFAPPSYSPPRRGASLSFGNAIAGATRMLRSLPARLIQRAVYIMPTAVQDCRGTGSEPGAKCPSLREFDLHELLLYFHSRDHRILLPKGGVLRQSMILQDEILAVRKA